MAEAQNYIFTFREIAEALVKRQDIHEGLWAIYVEFGIGAGHIPMGLNTDALMPAAVVPIVKMGIQRTEQATPLTVDAAEVNPTSRPGPKFRSRVQEGRERLETRKIGPRRKDGPTDEE